MAAWGSEGEFGREIAATPQSAVVVVATHLEAIVGSSRAALARSLPGSGPRQTDRPADERTDPSAAPAPVASASIGCAVRQPAPRRRLSAEWATRLNVAVDLALISAIVLANGLGAFSDGGALPTSILLVALIAVW